MYTDVTPFSDGYPDFRNAVMEIHVAEAALLLSTGAEDGRYLSSWRYILQSPVLFPSALINHDVIQRGVALRFWSLHRGELIN